MKQLLNKGKFFNYSIIALILIIIGHIILFISYTIDDAFIIFKYSKNFISGQGAVLNIGEKVNANSSFLWMILLSPFEFLHDGALYGSKIIGLVFLFIAIAISVKIINSLVPKNQNKYLLLLLLLVAFNGTIINWSVYGLENSLVYMLLVLLTYYLLLEIPIQKGYKSILVLFALIAARPEGFIFIFYYVVVFLIYKFRSNVKWDYFFKSILLIVIFSILYYGIMILYYGNPLPNTVYAKMGGSELVKITTGMRYVFSLKNLPNLCLLFFPPIIWIILRYRNQEPIVTDWKMLVLFSLGAVYFIFPILVGGDWMPNYRFISFGLLLNIITFVIVFSRSENANRILSRVLWAIVLLYSLLNILVISKAAEIESKLQIATLTACKGAAETINSQNYDLRNKIVAASDIGMLSYYGQARVLDYWGLADKYLARTGYSNGNVNWDYVLGRKPKFIIIYSNTPTISSISFKTGMAIVSASLFQKEEFLKEYSLFKSFYFWEDRYHLLFERKH